MVRVVGSVGQRIGNCASGDRDGGGASSRGEKGRSACTKLHMQTIDDEWGASSGPCELRPRLDVFVVDAKDGYNARYNVVVDGTITKARIEKQSQCACL